MSTNETTAADDRQARLKAMETRLAGLVASGDRTATPSRPERTCARCGGEGRIVAEEFENAQPRLAPCPDCELPRRARTRARKIARPVPDNWAGWSWERLGLDAGVERRLREWADLYVEVHEGVREHGPDFARDLAAKTGQPFPGLWLTGPTGTTKTGAAAVLVQEIGRRLSDVGNDYAAFHTVDRLLSQLRATQHDDARVRLEERRDMLAEVDLLVLDDVVAPKHTEFSVGELYTILNDRYSSTFKPIIFTADATETEIEQIFARAAGRDNVGLAILRRWSERATRIVFPERNAAPAAPVDPVAAYRTAITSATYGQPPERRAA